MIIPVPDPSEVADWKYISHDTLAPLVKYHPEKYTEWFKLCLTNWHDEIFTKK